MAGIGRGREGNTPMVRGAAGEAELLLRPKTPLRLIPYTTAG